MIIGIDLGTTHSLVGCYHGDKIQLIKNSHGHVLTPSIVSVDDNDTLLIGESAKHRLLTHPKSTAAEFKRFMGSNKTFELGNHHLDAIDLSTLILKSLKADAEAFCQQTITRVVISVPAYFNNQQREATIQAGKLAAFKEIRLINEPTAAALAFGADSSKEGDEAHYMILDLGGGTFDISLLEVFNGIFEIHASSGDNHLGGKDFTDVIAQDLLIKADITAKSLTQKEQNKLYETAEQIKRELSLTSRIEKQLNIKNIELKYSLTIAGFTHLCESLLDRIRRPIMRVMSDANIKLEDINAVILVGGSTRMPLFRTLVSSLFKRIPRNDYHPDEAIVTGCIIQAGLTDDNVLINDIVMTDVCPYTLGVAVVGQGNMDEQFLPLIERNSTIPVSETRPLSPAHPEQKNVCVKVFQGESFNPANNLYLGDLVVELPDNPAHKDFFLTYTYDLDGTIEVEVFIPATEQRYKIYIQSGSSNQEINEHEASVRFEKLQSLKILPHNEQKNRELLSRLERLYEDLLGEQREIIGSLLADFIQALKSCDRKKIKQHYQHIDSLLHEWSII